MLGKTTTAGILHCMVLLLAVSAMAAPPSRNSVQHQPQQPKAGQKVSITVRLSAAPKLVQLQWQAIQPGEYIRRTDPAYEKNWQTQDLRPGANAFEIPGDQIKHRWLYRYRLVVNEADGKQVTLPDPKDASPNFAFFCYDGLPSWTGAREPGKTPERTFSSDFLKTWHVCV